MNKFKKTIIYILCIIVAINLIACQSTPERKAVVKKNGTLERKVEESAAPEQKYDAPSMYKNSFSNDKNSLKIAVDAMISIPQTTEFPVYKLSIGPFSQEKTDILLKMLLGDNAIYELPKGTRSKSEIEADLIHMKQLYSEVQRGVYGEIPDTTTYTDRIKELEKELTEAPDINERAQSDGRLENNEFGTKIHVESNLGKAAPATFKIDNDNDSKSYSCFFQNGNEYFADGGENEQIDELAMTPESAMNSAASLLKENGFNDLYPLFTRIGSAYTTAVADADAKGYVVFCGRIVNNIPVTYNEAANSDEMSAGAESNPNTYSPAISGERLLLTYDDSGLTSFRWENPVEIEMMNSNVQLENFDNMLQTFQQAMINKYSWIGDPDRPEGTIKEADISITKINLGYARTPVKNSPGEYMLVPAWDFFGNYTYKYEDKEDSSLFLPHRSFMTINAVDRSIINLAS